LSKLKVRQTGELDQFDLAILEILQQNNGTSLQEIGEQVNLSGPAVQRRIKRLEKEKVIRSNVAILDAEKLSVPITILVSVDLESERHDLVDEAKAIFKKNKEVQQCYYVAGEADFILIVMVATMSDYNALTQKLFFDNKNVKRFRTFVTMDPVKVGLTIPLLRL
jgi:DNA-binding Lrp family transcriptional regulator